MKSSSKDQKFNKLTLWMLLYSFVFLGFMEINPHARLVLLNKATNIAINIKLILLHSIAIFCIGDEHSNQHKIDSFALESCFFFNIFFRTDLEFFLTNRPPFSSVNLIY